MTPEELDNLQKLLSGIAPVPPVNAQGTLGMLPPPSTDVPAPPPEESGWTGSRYDLQGQKLSAQADALESKLNMKRPQPHGAKEQLINALRAMGESFGRFGAPGGYEGQEALRQKQFQEQQQFTYERAKELRTAAQQQQALGETARNRQDVLDETKRLRAVQEREAAAKEAASRRPIIENVPAGGTALARDPVTGLPIEGSIVNGTPKESQDKHVGSYVNKAGHQMEIFQKPDGDVYEKEFGETRPPQSVMNPGPFTIITDAAGGIQGAWSPKTNQTVPAPPGVQNMRKTGASPTEVNKVAELENSYRKVIDLGTSYKPEFVGPTQGRILRSEATGVLSYLPFLQTPEGYGEFSALSADLKNSVIKLITGAQMGQQEAQRILQQVPVESDKPEIWAAKYEQTKKNAAYLLQEIQRLSGVGGGAPAPQAPATPGAPAPAAPNPNRTRVKL